MAKKNKNEMPAAIAARDDCLIPPALPKAELHKLLFKQSDGEAQRIKDYVEHEAHGETVLHAEKVASERVFEHTYDVWDVHTDKERWWVVGNPTNLYSQTLMPSLDYTLSFHIGLMARIAARREPEGSEAQQQFLLTTNRKFVQASESFDQADEAEEFQAVGMRCREVLLALIRELTDEGDLISGEDLPKAGDFTAWNERLANAIACGASNDKVRAYLKLTGERAWQLVNWLTHTSNATRGDAELALSATSHIMNNYALSVLRRKIAAPERCEQCKSYRMTIAWRPDLGATGLYVSFCESCGAEGIPSGSS